MLEGLPDAANGLCSAGARAAEFSLRPPMRPPARARLGHWAGTPGSKLQTIQTFPEGSRPRGIAVAEGELYVALLARAKW